MNGLFSKLVGALIIGTFIAGYYLTQRMVDDMSTPRQLNETITIDFKPGSTIRTLASQLIELDLLEEALHLVIWTKIQKQDTRLQAGEYLFEDGDSVSDLVTAMANGKVVQHAVTLIEGYTFRQALTQMMQHPMLEITLEGLSDDEIMAKLGKQGEHPEGRFYPDTYYVHRGMSDLDVLRRAYERMQTTLAEEWQNRSEGLPLDSAYEALILASIVEKESAVAEERPLIAGVFINRLRKNMRLQTDPTVIYGIEDYDGDIRYRDLRKDTPYNTYTRHGLTPTPIALAGREAIHATLHPDTTEYLYFVAYGDNSGRHYFSTNLKDHEAAVDKYQRNRRQNKVIK